MTRDQRTVHARTFYVLAPLLLAALIFAFAREQWTAARIGRHAERPVAARSQP
jgi:ABC-type amino acid transport system permease subunit